MRSLFTGALLAILFFSTSDLNAQSGAARAQWKALCDSGWSLLRAGDYLSANRKADSALRIARRFSQRDSIFRQSFDLLGEVLARQGFYKKADALFREQRRLVAATKGRRDSSYAYALDQLAFVRTRLRDYRGAGLLYREALTLRLRTGGKSKGYLSTLNNYALLCNALGRYQEAVSALREVVHLKDSLGQTETADYATNLSNLGVSYQRLGRSDSAEILYNAALALRARLTGVGHPYYLSDLTFLAEIYTDQGQHQRALDLYNNTLVRLDTASLAYATLLRYIGGLYYGRRQWDSAGACYTAAYEMLSRRMGALHPEVINAYADFPAYYNARANTDSARGAYVRLLSLTERSQGRGLDYANRQYSYANFLRSHEWYAEAETQYRQVLAVYSATMGRESLEYIGLLRELGYLYYLQGRDAPVIAILKQAQRLGLSLYGPQNIDYSSTLNDLALVYARRAATTARADALYRQSLAIKATVYGKKNRSYLTVVANLALNYKRSEAWAKAAALYDELLPLRNEVLGEQHPDYWATLREAADTYEKLEQTEKAEHLYLQALNLRRRYNDTASASYLELLSDLGVLYDEADKMQQAFPYYQQAVALCRQLSGSNSPLCARELTNLADWYKQVDSLEHAATLYTQALSLWKRVSGANTDDYSECRDDLITTYKNLERYRDALPLMVERVASLAATRGTAHPDYTDALCALAGAHIRLGNFIDSRNLFQQALNTAQPNTEGYAVAANGLGIAFSSLGEYARAIPLLQLSLQINQRLSGKDIDYAISLNNLASIYARIGEQKKAQQCFREALAIAEKIEGRKSARYASYLADLASQQKVQGKYEEALRHYGESLNVLRKFRKGERLANVLDALGDLHLRMKNYPAARSCFDTVAALFLQLRGPESADYANCLDNTARLCMAEGRFSEAITATEQRLAIRARASGKNSRSYIDGYNRLAYYNFRAQRAGTRDYLLQGLRQWYGYIRRQLGSFSAREQEQMLAEFSGPQEIALSALSQNFPQDAVFRNVLFNTIACYNGLVLQGQSLLNGWAQKQKDSSILARYQHWRGLNEQLTQMLQQGIAPDSMEQQVDDAQKALLSIAPSFAKVFQKDTISTARIARALKPGEVLVNWVPYRWHTAPGGATDSILYGAFVLRNGDAAPLFLNVFEQKPLKEALRHYYNKGDRGIANSRAKTDSVNMDSLQKRLYQLVWKPLRPYLKNASRVYLLPAGLLNKLSFNALIDEEDSFLVSRYELHTILNIRDLENRISTDAPIRRVALFGGARYDSLASAAGADSTEFVASYVPGKGRRAAGAARFGYLEGTRREVERIQALLPGRALLFEGAAASEGNFKRNSGAGTPDVLHIATHGFYFPQESGSKESSLTIGERFRVSDQPLLRSGLVLSGVNRFWNSTAPASIDDGILTAQEIANLDFSDLQLVVLSACQTALGDINHTQGVYGLQRAFRMAGVQTMIISLWEVPDAETAELMTAFYQEFVAGTRAYDAFHKAQKLLKDKYHDPHKWAAFILLGE